MGEDPRPLPPDYGLREPLTPADAYEQGRELALQERRRLGLGGAPLPDMAEVLSGQGVWAASAALQDTVSGLSLFHSRIGAAIVVNRIHGRSRRRFSYAHEYAHVLADRKTRTVAVSSSSNARELIERRANSFASEFLMPATGVAEFLTRMDKGGPSRVTMGFFDSASGEGEQVEKRNLPGSQEIGFHDVAFLADRFRVSYDAAAYRLGDLGKVNRERLRALLDQREDGRINDFRDGDPPFLENYLLWLAREAYRREVISVGRFRDVCALVGLNVEEEYARVQKHFD